MLVQSLSWFCQGELLHGSCVQTAGSLPAVLMKSCCLKDLHTSTCGPRRLYCSWYWLGSDSGLFFDVFWCSGVLACWRSGSGGAEKLCAVDVKKLAARGWCQIFQMCRNRLFWRQKQKKDGGNNKRKGVRADKCMIFTSQLIRCRDIFENILKSGNERRMDLAFLASFWKASV